MDEEKKDEKLLEIDGVEEWMTQFVIDPFLDGNTDGIKMDLFETESSYIIEAIVPGYKKDNLVIKVVKDGIHISLTKDSIETRRFVNLPFSLCERRITATLVHDILEIMIHKKKKRKMKMPYRSIKIR
jgi:HSP20 family molecular chaperone IbpA